MDQDAVWFEGTDGSHLFYLNSFLSEQSGSFNSETRMDASCIHPC